MPWIITPYLFWFIEFRICKFWNYTFNWAFQQDHYTLFSYSKLKLPNSTSDKEGIYLNKRIQILPTNWWENVLTNVETTADSIDVVINFVEWNLRSDFECFFYSYILYLLFTFLFHMFDLLFVWVWLLIFNATFRRDNSLFKPFCPF